MRNRTSFIGSTVALSSAYTYNSAGAAVAGRVKLPSAKTVSSVYAYLSAKTGTIPGNNIDYEIRDLSITAGDDVAFSHSLNRMRGTMKNDQKEWSLAALDRLLP